MPLSPQRLYGASLASTGGAALSGFYSAGGTNAPTGRFSRASTPGRLVPSAEPSAGMKPLLSGVSSARSAQVVTPSAQDSSLSSQLSTPLSARLNAWSRRQDSTVKRQQTAPSGFQESFVKRRLSAPSPTSGDTPLGGPLPVHVAVTPSPQNESVPRPPQPSAPQLVLSEQDIFAHRWQSKPSNSSPLPLEEIAPPSGDIPLGIRTPRLVSCPGVQSLAPSGGLPLASPPLSVPPLASSCAGPTGMAGPSLALPGFAPLASSPPLGADFALAPQPWASAPMVQSEAAACAEGPVVMPRETRTRSEDRHATSQVRRRRSAASHRSATSRDRSSTVPANEHVAWSAREGLPATARAPAVVPSHAGLHLAAGPLGARPRTGASGSEERILNLLTDAGWDSLAFQDGEDLQLLARAFLQQRGLNAAFGPGLQAQLLQMANMRLLTASVDIVDLI